jgi:hypothetical protein
MTNYIAPTVTDRGSVVARTLGGDSHTTLESVGKRNTSLAGFGDADPVAGQTFERQANGTITTTMLPETVGDAD